MGYSDAQFLSETLTTERVTSRGNDGNQDKTYADPVSYDCREETCSEVVINMKGVEVLATSFVFIDASIFIIPEGYSKYTLPSGQEVELAKADAIKENRDASVIHHWEAYFTKK